MKRIKGFAALAMAIVAAGGACFSSCTGFWTDLFGEEGILAASGRELTDAAMEDIVAAIADRDAAAVKATFRAADTAEAEGFDESVEQLIEYITGDGIAFEYMNSGSDEKALGGDYTSRVVGAGYLITTSTDSYKVSLSYCALYKDNAANEVVTDEMGIIYFDVINVENDREGAGIRNYSGSPVKEPGIHLDCRTVYPADDLYTVAYYETGEAIDPVLVNSVEELQAFYAAHAETCALESREDGYGFADVIAGYDEAFFEAHTLYIEGFFKAGAGYTYTPQWLYVGFDYVMADIYAWTDEDMNVPSDGVMILMELPEKRDSDFAIRLDR